MVSTTKEDTAKLESQSQHDAAPIHLSQNLEASSQIISSAVKWSAATSLIPVPVLDLAALAAVQVKMVSDLCRQYGHSFSEEAVRGVISVLLGAIVPNGLATYTTAALARGVPVVGVVVNILTLGGFSAASTYAVGKILVGHFEGGGTFQNFSPEAVRGDLAREFANATAKS